MHYFAWITQRAKKKKESDGISCQKLCFKFGQHHCNIGMSMNIHERHRDWYFGGLKDCQESEGGREGGVWCACIWMYTHVYDVLQT